MGDWMKNKLIKMLPYLGLIAVAMYLFPLLAKDTGSYIVVLLFGVPLGILLVSIVYGANIGIDVVFSLIVGMIFIPAILIHYNSSALIYTLIYTGVSLLGLIMGRYVFRR